MGAPNRILVVQLGTKANEAKVFKVHAAPHRLCENLINALKLLANQQKDGDSPIQSIVTGLHERTRKGIMDGLRSFIDIDKPQCSGRGSLAQGRKAFLSRSRTSVKFAQRRPSGKEQMI